MYDADNQPEPHALRMLVEHAETTEDAVGAVGHVRTVNEKRNWLTRMISLNFKSSSSLCNLDAGYYSKQAH